MPRQYVVISLFLAIKGLGGLLVTDNVGFAGAAAFNQEIFASRDWRAVHLLGFLPLHSPEQDGLSLAVRVG